MIARFGKIVVCCMRGGQITAASAGNVVDGGDGAGRDVCFAAAPCRESLRSLVLPYRAGSQAPLYPRMGQRGGCGRLLLEPAGAVWLRSAPLLRACRVCRACRQTHAWSPGERCRSELVIATGRCLHSGQGLKLQVSSVERALSWAGQPL
jgi:hypothetical protein